MQNAKRRKTKRYQIIKILLVLLARFVLHQTTYSIILTFCNASPFRCMFAKCCCLIRIIIISAIILHNLQRASREINETQSPNSGSRNETPPNMSRDSDREMLIKICQSCLKRFAFLPSFTAIVILNWQLKGFLIDLNAFD